MLFNLKDIIIYKITETINSPGNSLLRSQRTWKAMLFYHKLLCAVKSEPFEKNVTSMRLRKGKIVFRKATYTKNYHQFRYSKEY